ncbi:hypothetical protein TCSYLVIO_009175, partial [Trypanosoma cruzi]
VAEAESPVVRRESAARGVCDEAVAEEPGPSRVPAFVLPAFLALLACLDLRWRPAHEVPAKKTMKQSRHPHGRPCQTIGTPGRARRVCGVILWTNGRTLPQIEQEEINPPLAGRQKFAALTSGRGSGGGRGGPVSSVKKGTAPPTQRVTCDLQGARRPVEEREESHRAFAEIRHSGTMSGSTPGTESSPHRKAPVMRCARLPFSSWNFFQYGRRTAVRKSTCQALTQSCGRDRAMTATASAVTLRGIPRRHGENVESTVRTRSASESGTVQIASATSSCTASGPRRSASIAERESVAT